MAWTGRQQEYEDDVLISEDDEVVITGSAEVVITAGL